jgi:hypothetical protein
MSLTIDSATMATINSSPVLAIVTDNALTTWRCLTESQPSIFYPHGDVPISDVAWNHNGQGELSVFETALYDNHDWRIPSQLLTMTDIGLCAIAFLHSNHSPG